MIPFYDVRLVLRESERIEPPPARGAALTSIIFLSCLKKGMVRTLYFVCRPLVDEDDDPSRLKGLPLASSEDTSRPSDEGASGHTGDRAGPGANRRLASPDMYADPHETLANDVRVDLEARTFENSVDNGRRP